MIRIITDSMSDISQEEAASLGIHVLPLTVRFDQEEFLDGIDITLDEYYGRMENVTELPKTSQVSPDTFRHAFIEELQAGNQVLCIAGSSRLSGTCQSAIMARSMLEEPEKVRIVDSMNASLGQSLLVFQAVKLLNEGKELENIAAEIEALVPRVRVVGMADQLKYLVMGGRINAGVGAIGTTLGIKPMVKLAEGRMGTAGLCHGKVKVKRWFCDKIREFPADSSYPMHFAGAHADAEVAELKAAVEKAGLLLPQTDSRQIGPVIGTHTGPGLLAIAWVEK